MESLTERNMTSESVGEMKELKCHWELIKRRLDPGNVLFEEGDSYCRCLQKCLPTDERNSDLESSSKEFPCGISNCHQVFDSLIRYEAHYNSNHRHMCQTCQRIYPTSHLLELHILETHDVMFALLAQNQCMFQCLLADCPSKFKTWKDRKKHMIKVHKYPPNYRYDRAKSARQTKATGAPAVTSAATRDNIKSTRENKDDKGENIHKEEAMEADISEPSLAVSAEPIPVVNTDQQHRHVFSYRVPKDISFGQGVPRGFLGSRGRGRGRGRQKKKHWHNTSDSDTRVDIESVSMKDLSDALS